MRNGMIAVVASCSLLYGCSASWPHAAATMDPAFAHRAQPIQKIDVLPIDLELWADDHGDRGDLRQLRADAEDELATAVVAGLRQRGYIDNAMIQWDGYYAGPDGHPTVAMDRRAVRATVRSLASYGTAAERANHLPVPFLPAHLGDATGGDATLYVGGWSFVGTDESEGTEIVTGVVVGLIALGIIAVAVMAMAGIGGAGGHDRDHRDGDDEHHESEPSGPRVRDNAHALAHHGSGGIGTTVDHRGGGGGGRTVDHRGSISTGGDVGTVVVTHDHPHDADAFGHTDTSIAYVDETPDWSDDDHTAHAGPSAMYVEMTLVDNHTGLTLWHVHQRFPASGRRPGDIDRVAASLLATLPQAP